MSILSWDEFNKQQKGEYELTIAPSDLRLGDFVVRVDTADPDLSFPPAGMAVQSFEEKQWFRSHCRRVVIDLHRCLHRGQDASARAEAVGARLPPLPERINALRSGVMTPRGVIDAWRVYRETSLSAQSLMLSFHRHGRVDVEGTRDVVAQLVESLDTFLLPLVWLTNIRERSRYSYQHGLNVAILASAFARSAGWSRELVEGAALAGLLFDLGKTRLSLKVIQKQGELEPRELEHVRQHARFGHDLLAQSEGIPQPVLAAVHSHHERPDGKGYPDALPGDQIPVLARLIGLVDAYDAIASHRHHAAARSHQQALGLLWRERDRQFDRQLVESFSQFLGWAPPGTLVRLATGHLAVVVHHAEGSTRPLARKLNRVQDGYRLGIEVDLTLQGGSGSVANRVQEVLPAGGEGVNMREITRILPRALGSGNAKAPPDRRPISGGLGRILGLGQGRERRRTERVDAPRGMRILVVDDSPTVRKTLDNMLDQAGYRVELAEDGESGLEAAFISPPDLMFLDIVLPDSSGFSVLRRLRREPRTVNVPVVMISGSSKAADDFFLRRVGAEDFIHKPFGRFEVFSCIERLVRAGTLPRRPGQKTATATSS
ncbi:MAG: response regulator [Wenzhouxiangella sp.]|nr:response regulator [Wenzhouxiangella sp.]TVR94530.1 MAG: response regulator [Wenzhouxiangellaceae bacterium]